MIFSLFLIQWYTIILSVVSSWQNWDHVDISGTQKPRNPETKDPQTQRGQDGGLGISYHGNQISYVWKVKIYYASNTIIYEFIFQVKLVGCGGMAHSWYYTYF